MIKLEQVRVFYKHIAFHFEDAVFKTGTVTCIRGKNGFGKTTLLRAIAGLHEYTGTITTSGVVTYTSQEPVVFDRSVYDNIVYPLRIRNKQIEDYKETIDNYMKLLELDRLKDQNAKKLSSGEKMKVSIIRSIIFDPDIVLLDEPTTHLDLESIAALITLIKQLKNTITFIIVSHNQVFIDSLADVIYKVGEGYVPSQTDR